MFSLFCFVCIVKKSDIMYINRIRQLVHSCITIFTQKYWNRQSVQIRLGKNFTVEWVNVFFVELVKVFTVGLEESF